MTKPDPRQTLRPAIPAQTPATTIKTPSRTNLAPERRVLAPCNQCRWRAWDSGTHRCHLNPPQMRIPYDNMSAWPVVPATGGGCSKWETL